MAFIFDDLGSKKLRPQGLRLLKEVSWHLSAKNPKRKPI
jgi:hypothetical protein